MQSLIQYIEKELDGLYPPEEIRGFARLIIEHVCGLDYTQFVVNRERMVSVAEKEMITEIIEHLKNFEPIQYILGETEFYGLRLKVRPDVLIPRPETEELVHWVLETNQLESPAILDVGTGSGCIALVLKKELPEAKVSAIDISEEALKVAHENALQNQLDISFLKHDILNPEKDSIQKFDLIVSNPPYVREQEKEKMQPNVLNFEPQSALFVSDSDPLIFYRKIGEYALEHLSDNGFLFFEINEYLCGELKELLSGMGFKDAQLKKDLHGKNRMLRCRKS